MAKIRISIAGALLDMEGTDESIDWASRMFHRVLAEQALREVEDKLSALRPLQKQQRELRRQIADLKAREKAQAVDAVDPVGERVTG